MRRFGKSHWSRNENGSVYFHGVGREPSSTEIATDVGIGIASQFFNIVLLPVVCRTIIESERHAFTPISYIFARRKLRLLNPAAISLLRSFFSG